MENSNNETSAVWNPALRTNDNHETDATVVDTSAPVPSDVAPSTSKVSNADTDIVSNATDSVNAESPARGESAELPPNEHTNTVTDATEPVNVDSAGFIETVEAPPTITDDSGTVPVAIVSLDDKTSAPEIAADPSSVPQDTVPDVTESSIVEPIAFIEAAQAESATGKAFNQTETREEFREEVAELFSAAADESHETDAFEPEADPAAAPGDGFNNLQSMQEEHVLEEQTHQLEIDTSVNAVQGSSAYPTAGWVYQQGTADNATPVDGELRSTNHDLWGSPKSVDNGEDRFFDQLRTQTKPIYFPPEESRFEEGVPLLDGSAEAPVEATPVEQAVLQPGQLDRVFEGDEDEDDGFFSSAQQLVTDKEPQEPVHIHRKSTSQVLDSLDANRNGGASPLSPTAEEFNDVLAAAASKSPEKVQEPASEEDLAARWQAELSDDDLEVATVEEDLAAKWQAELEDDDLLLEEEPGDLTQDTAAVVNGDSVEPNLQALGSPFGTPQNPSKPKPAQSVYTPHQPSTADLVQGVPMPGAAPLASSAPYSANYFQPRPDPPAIAVRAESFAERPKEGYKSPYDLPEDLAPRRKPAAKPVVASAANVPAPPPPRSSSFTAPPPPQSSSGVPVPPTNAVTLPPASKPNPPAASTPKNFYEELPLPPVRPRSRPTESGRYTPNVNAASPAFVQPPPPAHPVTNPYAQFSGDAPQSQLQQPERLGPFANNVGPSGQSAPAVPPVNSRYSPKPPTLQPGVKPPASPRYSPAPPPPAAASAPLQRYASQPSVIPGQTVTLPFQPRTSSPLAHHEKVSYQPNEASRKSSLPQPTSPVTVQPSHTETATPISPRSSQVHAPGPAAVDASSSNQQTSPPRNPYAPPSYLEEFSRRVSHVNNNTPSAYTPPPETPPFVPPRRSQTQSPTQQQSGPRLSVPSADPLKRPASVHAPSSPTKTSHAYAPMQTPSHIRTVSQSLEFIPPSDGQELDPLQRWKGAPIFKFGFGGTVLSSFPKHVPRYSAGQTAPKIKSMPGDVKTTQLKEVIPFPETIVRHPGPLRNKSKKKDLVAWLSSRIAAFENEGIPQNLQPYPDSHKRHDEKILLWKVVRVLVEHDGGMQSTPDLQEALRGILFPHLQANGLDPMYGDSFQSFGAEQINASLSDSAESKSLSSIRNNLLIGEREKAVWNAADNRLWGHAMIIASTLDKSIWKQVVQEFVRREVRSTSGNSESLAALYEIFAGNFEESVDELVPPSARAGLQMVSKVDGHGPSKDSLAGLESWKDTLGLVLNNRSPEDYRALLALGRLLLSYGRIEAAHICLTFSRAAVFGGPDDPQASIVLLGVDHVHSSPTALLDDDAILLTEAYEYATSVLGASPTSTLPHLLALKLVHAWSLTDQGRKSEAQQYCDAITAALKATTKQSGYHHQHLFFGVDELSARLKQTTGDGGSWISKPSMEKVSSSMWNKFSNFVAGDDSDAASTGSGKGGETGFGPFAQISGTPTVSRSPSVTDLYGQYPMPVAQQIPGAGTSRYQPNNQTAPSSSPDQGRGRSSLDSQRSASFGLSYGQRRGSLEYGPPSESPMYGGGPFYGSPSAGYQSTPPQTSYMPLAPVEEDLAQQAYTPPTAAPQGPFGQDSPYQPPARNSFDQSTGPEAPAPQHTETAGYMPPTGNTGYEPPASNNPEVEVTEESEDEKPRKKLTMDDEDEDDIAARAEALKKAEKERKDREADEAFRKAAEADAKKPAPAKSSWWGWIKGGNKEEANSGKPIRAKLGEESSFYYDKELKKWVNKKDPNSATPARATPPPPKAMGPPSRAASGSSMPPPSGPAGPGSRPPSAAPPPSGSPAPSSLGLPPTPGLGPARSASTGAVPPAGSASSRPGSSAGPPPRPSTSLSHASSIDDLLGAPQARKGATSRGRKKGRYVDVMAQ
ncbi:Sec23-binding domain of Sec16-domain-containing protein [Aspergillus spinulosporus]